MRFVALATIFAAGLLALNVDHAEAQGRWVPCASEGGVCNVPYATTVRYGARGAFAQRRVGGGGVPCSNDVFGDPLVGVTKQCAYLAQADGPQAGAWRRCADEGEFCAFRGQATVRYGARGAFAYRRATGGIHCDNDHFGDPLVGVVKSCDIQE